MEEKHDKNESLDSKIEKLISFFNEYGEDYLQDNTKKRIIAKLKKKDYKVALEVLDKMDKSWVKKVKETGKFYTFTDIIRTINPEKRITYRASYIGSSENPGVEVPAFRMEKRYREKEAYFDEDDFYDRFYR